MKLYGISTLVLASMALGHVVPYGLDSDNTSVLLERQTPQSGLTSVKVVQFDAAVLDKTASGRCTRTQTQYLRTAIKDARQIFDNAGKVLAKGNTEQSTAYKNWFGVHTDSSGRPSASVRKSIGTHNFEAPYRHLDPNGLTFTCWHPEDLHCQIEMIAGTIPPGWHQGLKKEFKGTLIGLCPDFFELPRLEETIRKFERKDKTLRLTAPLTIVHEMQHILLITGKERWCTDHYDASKKKWIYDAEE
ncbi:hypothetical protein AK830_g3866 [Neonectria ditissima]|uniref:Lysine-specific metallo-endopeptidase domain-containing protein n=1 Tax=Neonectria ditissima TaxID=78410 RepID=A0A0P7BPH8_9HYPO|nr:hypothetical protein AK830_g3866 [Neonectria ditissima]